MREYLEKQLLRKKKTTCDHITLRPQEIPWSCPAILPSSFAQINPFTSHYPLVGVRPSVTCLMGISNMTRSLKQSIVPSTQCKYRVIKNKLIIFMHRVLNTETSTSQVWEQSKSKWQDHLKMRCCIFFCKFHIP